MMELLMGIKTDVNGLNGKAEELREDRNEVLYQNSRIDLLDQKLDQAEVQSVVLDSKITVAETQAIT